MARTARKISSTGIYHIILRGVNHKILFEDESDYKLFLYVLKYYKEICNYQVYAYCLMDNHVHMLIRFQKGNMSQAMKRIEDKFCWWYNKKYDRCGHLFQERFKSEPVEDERYLATVFRYIHHNPMKAGVESKLGEYRWSSYLEYKDEKINLIDSEAMVGLFGKKEKLVEYLSEASDDICMEYKTNRLLDAEVKKIIKETIGDVSINEIYKLDIEEQRNLLLCLRNNGASIRQLCRVTGLSRNYINKI